MSKVLVVGTGLFGSIAAIHLRSLGHAVTTVDARNPEYGSGAAACLIKPTWLNSMEKDQIKNSLDLLDTHYGVQDLQFSVGLGIQNLVKWVNPSSILQPPGVEGRLKVIRQHGLTRLSSFVQTSNGLVEECFDKIVVACGVWTFSTLSDVLSPSLDHPIQGQAGQAHLYEGQLDDPFIKVWAPYKQIVAFNRDPKHIWVGDGASIKDRNWDKAYSDKNTQRCDDYMPNRKRVKSIFGIRPYVKDAKPCYLKEVTPGIWAITGGAKNGTIAAGWAAHELGLRI